MMDDSEGSEEQGEQQSDGHDTGDASYDTGEASYDAGDAGYGAGDGGYDAGDGGVDGGDAGRDGGLPKCFQAQCTHHTGLWRGNAWGTWDEALNDGAEHDIAEHQSVQTAIVHNICA